MIPRPIKTLIRYVSALMLSPIKHSLNESRFVIDSIFVSWVSENSFKKNKNKKSLAERFVIWGISVFWTKLKRAKVAEGGMLLINGQNCPYCFRRDVFREDFWRESKPSICPYFHIFKAAFESSFTHEQFKYLHTTMMV